MKQEVPFHLWMDFGPVSVDSNRLGPELGALAAVMVMLLAFRWVYKRL